MNVYKKSFNQFKNNALNLIGGTLIYVISVALLSSLAGITIPFIGFIVSFAVDAIATCLYIRFLIKIVDGESDISIEDYLNNCFKNVKYSIAKVMFVKAVKSTLTFILVAVFVATTIYQITAYAFGIFPLIASIASMLGFLLLMNLIIDLMLAFTVYVAVDDDFESKTLRETLKDGIKMMNGYRFKYILAKIAYLILLGFGAMFFGIGLFVSIPLGNLIILNLYLESKEKYINSNNKTIDVK